jgi:hypothetical protein
MSRRRPWVEDVTPRHPPSVGLKPLLTRNPLTVGNNIGWKLQASFQWLILKNQAVGFSFESTIEELGWDTQSGV